MCQTLLHGVGVGGGGGGLVLLYKSIGGELVPLRVLTESTATRVWQCQLYNLLLLNWYLSGVEMNWDKPIKQDSGSF